MSSDYPPWAAGFEASDPARAAALLLVPPQGRLMLAALHALVDEFHRAARASQEPMLNEIRLQWWIDAVSRLPEGQGQHPILEMLVEYWGDAAPGLAALGEGERSACEDETHEAILTRIDATAGALAWRGASVLGAGPEAEEAVRAQGRALGVAAELAHWDGEVAPLREVGQQAARTAASKAGTVPRSAAPVLFAGAAAACRLAGKPAPSEFARRKAVMGFALTRNWRIKLPG